MQHTQPDIRPIKESSNLYELAAPYSFHLGLELFIIPKGFKYDGASYAKLLFQRDGIHRAACLVHDYLYVNKGCIGSVKYSRKDADKKFKTMMTEAGLKSWHINLAYLSVRLFGKFYWSE